MKLFTNEQQKSYENFTKGKYEDTHTKDKIYCKVRNHCHLCR